MKKVRRGIMAALIALGLYSPANSQTLPPYRPAQVEKISPNAPLTAPTPLIKDSRYQLVERAFEYYLEALKATHKHKGRITANLDEKKIQEVRAIFGYIKENYTDNENDISKTQMSQDQKDFIYLWSKYQYRIYWDNILKDKIQLILSQNALPIDILTGRIRIPDPSSTHEHPVFNPPKNHLWLNNAILIDPKKHPYSLLSKVPHEDYYKLTVFLLLIENNFGGNITSSADARGPFQIKPSTIEQMEKFFKISQETGTKTYREYEEAKDHLNMYKREVETGILHLYYLADIYGIDYSKKPTEEEIIIITYSYFQGPGGYKQIAKEPLDPDTLRKLQEYSLAILAGFVTPLTIVQRDSN